MPIKITSKKVSKNNVHTSTIEITSEKVRGNNVDFSAIEITSKKYAEMTWKVVEIWSSTYRRNIHVDSTWCAHCVATTDNITFIEKIDQKPETNQRRRWLRKLSFF